MCLPTRRTRSMRARSSTADDFLRRRLQRFGLLAEPNRFDHVAGDTLVKTAGNGFDFG